MTKIKGITIWEQYVEHFVLGAVVIAALAFTVMQFIGSPNVVERPPHGRIAPGQIDSLLESEANRISLLLAARGVDDEPNVKQLLPEFERSLHASVSPVQRLSATYAHLPLGGTANGPDRAVQYHEPDIPTPRHIVARQYHDTLLDDVVARHALEELFTQRPYDLSWVTAAGVFDVEATLRSFRTGNADGEPAPLPVIWHNDQVFVANIVLEREEYLDGRWGNRTRIDPLPTASPVRDLLGRHVDSSGREELLRRLRDAAVRSAVIQPPFFPTKSGAWIAPNPFDAEDDPGDGQEQLRRMLRQRDDLIRRRNNLRDQIEALSRPSGRPGGVGDAGGPTGTGAGRAARDEDRLNTLRGSLTEVERALERITSDIERIAGHDIAHATDQANREVVFWSHDLDVKPGREYRYRFIVEVYNPLCARKLNLIEEQHHLAESYVLRSEPSEWSDPIAVHPPIRTFITRVDRPTTTALGPSLARAEFEIYRYYDGGWREHRMSVQPGQRVGEMRAQRDEPGVVVDFGTDWYVLDIIPDPDAGRGDARAARVILQNIRTGEIEERHPLWDAPERERLRREQERVVAGRSVP